MNRTLPATELARQKAVVDGYSARNRGLDLAAVVQTIRHRQKFLRTHVSPQDASVLCDLFVTISPAVRALLALLDRSSADGRSDILSAMTDMGVAILSLAEARAARDINDLARTARWD